MSCYAPPRTHAGGVADARKTPSLPSRRRLAIARPGRRSRRTASIRHPLVRDPLARCWSRSTTVSPVCHDHETMRRPAVTLSDRERTLLDLETGWWRHAGDKETAIAETLGCPVGDYYAELNRLIDRPEAEAAYPLVVRRLRRLRERRRTER